MCAWRRGSGAVHVHRASDVRVPHEPLLHPTGVPTASSRDRCVRRNVCELMLPMRALNAAFREVSATLPHRGTASVRFVGRLAHLFVADTNTAQSLLRPGISALRHFQLLSQAPLSATGAARRDLFLRILEQVRKSYRFVVAGCVVMPEQVHLLLSEPERADPGGWPAFVSLNTNHD